MDPIIEQSIANAVTFAVTAAVDAIQIKHEEKMLVLREMIKKSLFFRNFAFSTPRLNLNASSKALSLTNLHLKTTNK